MKYSFFLIFSFALAAMAANAGRPPAEEILLAADRARGHFEGMAWTVEVEAMESGRTSRERLGVRAATGNLLAVTEEPANRRGNTLLVHDDKVWFYKPGLSRPVPVSQRQRLLGLANYGDLASTDYARQYRAEYLEDAAIEGELCYVYDLHAIERGLLYERIVWWVSQERKVGIRADYYTLSGKLIKTARLWYDHVIDIDDKGTLQLFCSRMEITESLISKDRTTLTFSAPRPGPQPPSLFHVNRLGR